MGNGDSAQPAAEIAFALREFVPVERRRSGRHVPERGVPDADGFRQVSQGRRCSDIGSS
jgi:hypothetical protein